METTEEKKTWLKTKKAKILLITGIATLVVVIGVVLGVHIYYADRWYTNTWIGERNVSGMKYEDSKKLIDDVLVGKKDPVTKEVPVEICWNF